MCEKITSNHHRSLTIIFIVMNHKRVGNEIVVILCEQIINHVLAMLASQQKKREINSGLWTSIKRMRVCVCLPFSSDKLIRSKKKIIQYYDNRNISNALLNKQACITRIKYENCTFIEHDLFIIIQCYAILFRLI